MDLGEILRHTSKLQKEKIAITTPFEKVTYREFEDRCHNLGKALYGLGLERGDRIAILDHNSMILALAHFGLPACGMVSLPLNHRLKPKEIMNILENAQSSAILYSPAFKDTVDEIRSELPCLRYALCTESGAGEYNLPSLMKDPPSISWERPRPDDLATLLYTSGTTGKPKGVKLTHTNTISTIKSLLIELGLRSSDSGLMVAPLFHVAGCHTFMSLIARGCNVNLMPAFEPGKVLEAIATYRPSMTLLVPAMIGALLNYPGQEKFDLSSLRLIMYAGSPIPEELLKTAMKRFGHVFFQLYGLTETSVLTVLGVEEHKSAGYITSAGREMFGSEIRVLNEDGKEAFPGTLGEIIARGDNVTPGYWDAPEETAESLSKGWFHTGDIGMFDEAGYLYLKDRKKDMIVTGGENVYPVEVENVLYEIPGVLEAAVIGIPDEKWGERVLALVHLSPEQKSTEGEIISYCSQKLASYKCPKAVSFLGPLPRTPSGKVQKNVLREPYWRNYSRRVH